MGYSRFWLTPADEESKSTPHEFPRSHWLKATGQCVLERYLSATMGVTPFRKGGSGKTLEKFFRFKMYVEAILMHFEAILLLKLDLLDRHDMKLYSNVFQIPPPKYEQLFRPLDICLIRHIT